jgi:hypothetical protein
MSIVSSLSVLVDMSTPNFGKWTCEIACRPMHFNSLLKRAIVSSFEYPLSILTDRKNEEDLSVFDMLCMRV